jgi:mannose-6-phosphate isomerase-like protein (cupin superfamily)
LADFTIRNLASDVENAAEKFGMAPKVEAHFARADLDAEQLGISYQRLAPNTRMPFGHKHARQEEVYVVVDGSGRVKLDGELRDVREWDAVRVGPDTVRCFEAGAGGLALLVVGAPFEGANDAELIPGWWAEDGE